MEPASLLVSLLAPASRRALHKVLGGRFSRGERKKIHADTWKRYRVLEGGLPPEPTLGAKVMLRLAAATAALHETLLARGVSPGEAIKTVAEVNWLVYRRMADLPWWLSRPAAGADPVERVRKTMGWLMIYPYSKTGYDMRWAQTGPGETGFDVFRCPVADYFRSLGLAELGRASFCDLDHPLADRWGVRLRRPHTLVGGDDFCDFRYSPLPRA